MLKPIQTDSKANAPQKPATLTELYEDKKYWLCCCNVEVSLTIVFIKISLKSKIKMF